LEGKGHRERGVFAAGKSKQNQCFVAGFRGWGIRLRKIGPENPQKDPESGAIPGHFRWIFS
jgi:hypothetical protein